MRHARGSEVELEVSTVAHGGVFVARLENRVVFVPDAIPGERVRARIVDDRHDRWWRAEALEVLRASEHRRPHVWPEGGIDRDPDERAGGADFGHIELTYQRELKRHVLAEALARTAGYEGAVSVEAVGDDEERGGLGWRTRIRLHAGEDGALGPYAARTRRVVPVDGVPLATEEVAGAVPWGDRTPGRRAVDVIGPSTGRPVVLRHPARGGGTVTVRERVGAREFELPARGFWQVHRHAPATLTAAVVSLLDGAAFDPRAPNLDLYGGVGLFSGALADRFGAAVTVTSVESDRRATPFAVDNLSDLPNARVRAERVDCFLARRVERASRAQRARGATATVILDPPRSGAGADVVRHLARLGPAQLVYVACDPVALARDVALLQKHGYVLDALRAVDLFPHTHHVEAIARLRRA